MALLRIAQAQINTVVGDLEGNAARIARAIEEARKAGADIVAVPELALSGYPPEDLLLKPGFIRDCRLMLDGLARQSTATAAVVGFPDTIDGGVANAAAVIQNGQLAAAYKKVELPNYGVFDEKRYFTPGHQGLALDINGIRVLITVCEDLWIRGGITETHARDVGADLALNISASPYNAGKLDQRRKVMADFAAAAGTYVAYTNSVGGQDELVFDGGSLIMNPQGEILALARRFEEDLLITDLELVPRSRPKKNNSRGRTETLVMKMEPCREKQGKHPPALAPVPGPIDEIFEALILGVRDYVLKNGFEKVVIGLSGGVDSSLVAAVAAEALGPDKVVGVTMPSPYSSRETRSDAVLLALNLGITLLSVPINAVFGAYREELESVWGSGDQGVEMENLQARIRGNILMALSNRFGWLVLTTGNKSEMSVGYATLYGDMAGGFAVIKDVPKTVVYKLARRLNERNGLDTIPLSVIERPPTAELRPDQKDEDSLPPYTVLDPILRAYVEEDMSRDEIVGLGFEKDTVEEVIRMVDRNEYKRRQSPPGIKITPKAFGRDRRLPITNRYHA